MPDFRENLFYGISIIYIYYKPLRPRESITSLRRVLSRLKRALGSRRTGYKPYEARSPQKHEPDRNPELQTIARFAIVPPSASRSGRQRQTGQTSWSRESGGDSGPNKYQGRLFLSCATSLLYSLYHPYLLLLSHILRSSDIIQEHCDRLEATRTDIEHRFCPP